MRWNQAAPFAQVSLHMVLHPLAMKIPTYEADEATRWCSVQQHTLCNPQGTKVAGSRASSIMSLQKAASPAEEHHKGGSHLAQRGEA